MHHTIFDTPIINTLMRWFSLAMLRLTGWRVHGEKPTEKKYVLIGAPHTSNWDFPIALMLCFALGLRVYWMGKDKLFRWPAGWLMRWLGGIPIDRSKSGNMVQSTIDAFDRNQQLVVVIPPEGTRSKVTHWKTGFYYIALGAKVPIGLAFVDFKRKLGGIDKMFQPSGDIESDMAAIQEFYKGYTGKNPRQFDAATIQVKN